MSHLPVDPLFDNSDASWFCDDWPAFAKAIGIKIAKIIGWYVVALIIVGMFAAMGAAMGAAKRSIPKHIPHVKIEIGEPEYQLPPSLPNGGY